MKNHYRLVTQNFNDFYIVKKEVYLNENYDGFRPIFAMGTKKEMVKMFEKTTGKKFESKYEYQIGREINFDDREVNQEIIKKDNVKKLPKITIPIKKNFQGTIFSMTFIINNNECLLFFNEKSYSCKLNIDKTYILVKEEIQLKSNKKAKSFNKFKIPKKEQIKLKNYGN